MKENYSQHRPTINSNRRHKMYVEQGRCRNCGSYDKLPDKACCQHCYDANKNATINYHKRLRDTVYEHYGKKCVCCGETNPAFLTIDHVNGGGNQHRNGLKISGANPYFKMLRSIIENNFPDDFQIMCYNCNVGRYRNGGICTHKSGDESAAF